MMIIALRHGEAVIHEQMSSMYYSWVLRCYQEARSLYMTIFRRRIVVVRLWRSGRLNNGLSSIANHLQPNRLALHFGEGTLLDWMNSIEARGWRPASLVLTRAAGFRVVPVAVFTVLTADIVYCWLDLTRTQGLRYIGYTWNTTSWLLIRDEAGETLSGHLQLICCSAWSCRKKHSIHSSINHLPTRQLARRGGV